jgi:signal transduction histidine kinase
MTATDDATVVDAQIIADLRRDLGALAAQLTEERAQRTAMTEVLGVINASTGDLSPIFDAILQRATSLCRPAFGMMWTYDGEQFCPAAVHGPTSFVEFYRDQKRLPPVPGSGLARHVSGEDVFRSDDIAGEPLYKAGNARRRAFVELGGARSAISLALRRGDKLVGAIQVFRQEVRSFSDLEMTLLSDFAAQAVIAMENARAQEQSFNIALERDFSEGIAPIEVNPQDMTRVFLNIFNNGFYAATRRGRNGEGIGFMPTLTVTTRDADEAVEIRVRDNGTGIPPDIRDKLFQPFFTTKPTGEGTGLGLSITYDIVTQQHRGSIAVDSEVGEYSEFTIRLPRNP